MDRRTRNLFALVLMIVIAVTGGAALILGGSGSEPPEPSDGSFMVGVIVAVDSAGLGDVRGFTLRTIDGSLHEFELDALENPTEFPPGHLAEHQATAEPVRVFYRVDDGRALAFRLEDAAAT